MADKIKKYLEDLLKSINSEADRDDELRPAVEGGPRTILKERLGEDEKNLRKAQLAVEYNIRHTAHLDDVFSMEAIVSLNKSLRIPLDALDHLPKNVFTVHEYHTPSLSERTQSFQKDLIINETAPEEHAFFLTILFSKLFDRGFTPNICKSYGVQLTAFKGAEQDIAKYEKEKKMSIVTEALHTSLWQLLSEDSPRLTELRRKLGLPSLQETKDFELFECSDEFQHYDRQTTQFFINMVHQLAATLAVLHEQCEGMLNNLSPDNISIKATDDISLPLYKGTSFAKLRDFEYTIGGQTVKVPNLGFVVRLSNFADANAKFDFTRYPGTTLIYPKAGKIQYSKVPKPWSYNLEELKLGFAPAHWRRFWRQQRSYNYSIGYDLLFFMNIATQLKHFAFFEQPVVRAYFAEEMKRHALAFGSLANFRKHTTDESILSILKQKGWNIDNKDIILSAVSTPTGIILTTARDFLSDPIFRQLGRLYQPYPSFSTGLIPTKIDELSKMRGKTFADLSAVERAGAGISELRKSVFNNSARIQAMFGKAPTIPQLNSLTVASPAFIARGAQGFIHAVKIKYHDKEVYGALKSFKTLTGSGLVCERLNGNNITCSEVVNEMLISAVVSWLYESGICPNFMLLYSVFTAAKNPVKTWFSWIAENGTWTVEDLNIAMHKKIVEIGTIFLGKNAIFVWRARSAISAELENLFQTDALSASLTKLLEDMMTLLSTSIVEVDVALIQLGAVLYIMHIIDEDHVNALLLVIYNFHLGRNEELLLNDDVQSNLKIFEGEVTSWEATTDGQKYRQFAVQTADEKKNNPDIGQDVYTVMELINGDLNGFAKIVSKLQSALFKQGKKPHEIPTMEAYFENAMQQIVLALAIFQFYFNGTHGDFHPGNVFIKYCDSTVFNGKPLKSYTHFDYNVDGRVYTVPNLGFIIKIGDMGHSTLNIGKDTAGPKDEVKPDVQSVFERRTIHKEVVGQWRKFIATTLGGFIKNITEAIPKALVSLIPPTFRADDLVTALTLAQSLRDTGLFVESFDLSTLFNNLAAHSDFFREPIIATYGCLEKKREIEKYKKIVDYRRFFPNQFYAFAQQWVSIYLPRTTKRVITPIMLIRAWLTPQSLTRAPTPVNESIMQCANCGDPSELACGDCKQVGYCSEKCSNEHAPKHELVCPVEARERDEALESDDDAPETLSASDEVQIVLETALGEEDTRARLFGLTGVKADMSLSELREDIVRFVTEQEFPTSYRFIGSSGGKERIIEEDNETSTKVRTILRRDLSPIWWNILVTEVHE